MAGLNAQPALKGSVRYRDLFAELSAPLGSGGPLLYALDLTLGYRRSTERTTGAVDAYKAELSWAPVKPLRFRGSYQRAVRAPDIFERFEVPGESSALAADPCSADSPARTATVLDFCRRRGAEIGFTPDVVDEFTAQDEVETLIGGNPKVQPERATTLTLGAVWRPGWASAWVGGAHASVDWYDIKIKGAIGYLDAQLVLNGCYNIGGATNPSYDTANAFCRQFIRSPVDFTVIRLPTPETNQIVVETSGVDATLGFTTDLAELGGRDRLGTLSTEVAVIWLDFYRQQISPLQPLLDFAGTTAGGFAPYYQSLPRWKGLATVTWTSDPFSLDVTARYIDAMENRAALRPDGGRHRARRRLVLGPVGPLGAGRAGGGERRRAEPVRPRTGAVQPGHRRQHRPSTFDLIGRRFWVGLRARF